MQIKDRAVKLFDFSMRSVDSFVDFFEIHRVSDVFYEMWAILNWLGSVVSFKASTGGHSTVLSTALCRYTR